jgi:hypothetical protein
VKAFVEILKLRGNNNHFDVSLHCPRNRVATQQPRRWLEDREAGGHVVSRHVVFVIMENPTNVLSYSLTSERSPAKCVTHRPTR